MRENFSWLFIFVLCVGFASAGFFEGVFGGMTGNVVLSEEEIAVGCDNAKGVFEEEYVGYVVPDAIPFTTDVFDIYIGDVFFVSLELVEKKIVGISCVSSEDVSYNIYVAQSLIDEVISGDVGDDVVGFYNEKKASGELVIDAVGFGKSIKIGFINFGLWVAGFFS